MITTVEEMIEHYVQAWNKKSLEEYRAAFTECWANEGTYTDPNYALQGLNALIELAHTSVQEHQPAAHLHKAFQGISYFSLNFRLKNLPVTGKRAYKLLVWHLIILAKQKKRSPFETAAFLGDRRRKQSVAQKETAFRHERHREARPLQQCRDRVAGGDAE